MKTILRAAALTAAFALAACGDGDADRANTASNTAESDANVLDAAAGTIEKNVADNATSENAADALGNQAEAVSNAADAAEDAATANTQ